MTKVKHDDDHYLVGQEIYAAEAPELKLVIRRYIDKIYYCTIAGQPDHKDLVYFERELIKPARLLEKADIDKTPFKNQKPRAIIFCDGQFGKIGGKVTNGLIRHSANYEIVGVVDKTKSGLDSGVVLEDQPNNVFIYANIQQAIEDLGFVPDYFIYGITSGHFSLSEAHKKVVLDAIRIGMNIINPLPDLFVKDGEIRGLARQQDVDILDIGKVPARKDLHPFTGAIEDVVTPIIGVLGTDCAVGKSTTALSLVTRLQQENFKVVFVATGQTGLLQGAKYGLVLDTLSSEYAIGELEHVILTVVETERPDLIVIEGQGALSHPANTTCCSLLKGAQPDAIIIQHPPNRINYADLPKMRMPTLKSEIDLIEMFSETKVLAITLNHENMTDGILDQTIEEYEQQFHLPTTDVLKYGCDKLVKQIFQFFPQLKLATT